MKLPTLLLAFALVPPLARPVAALAAPAPVHLDARQIAAGEVVTEPLAAVTRAARIGAYGVVLDPARLAAASADVKVAEAEVAAAEAKLKLAQTAATRAAGLYRDQRNISAAELQTAEAGSGVATADLAVARAKLAALRARQGAAWGPVLAASIRTGGKPMPELESGVAALIEVSLPLGAALPTPPVTASALRPDGVALELRLLGPSPRVAEGAGQSMFYIAAGAPAPIGMPLTVSLPVGKPRPGVIVPLAAVVWQHGDAFVFRQTGAGAFAAAVIDPSDRTAAGYFVPDATGTVHAGDRIAVLGVALLFSESTSPTTGAAPAGGDDDD